MAGKRIRMAALVAAGLLAGYLIGPRVVDAADGEPVILGQNNTSTRATTIEDTSVNAGQFAFGVYNTSNDGNGSNGVGVDFGVMGETNQNSGVAVEGRHGIIGVQGLGVRAGVRGFPVEAEGSPQVLALEYSRGMERAGKARHPERCRYRAGRFSVVLVGWWWTRAPAA